MEEDVLAAAHDKFQRTQMYLVGRVRMIFFLVMLLVNLNNISRFVKYDLYFGMRE